MMALLKKGDEAYLAPVACRSTPLSNGYSAAELLMIKSLGRMCLAPVRLGTLMVQIVTF